MERARHEKTAIIIAAAAVLELIVLHVRMRSPHLFFVWLAQSFLHGRLDIAADSAASVGYLDLTMRQGMFFLPLGPFPAVVLAPLVALYGTTLSLTSALHVALAFVAAWLAYRLARAYGLDRPSATWLALAFCLGSTAFGVLFLEGPWYFAHAIILCLLLGALLEYKGRDRPLVIGTMLAAAVLTRLTAGVGLLFFAAMTVAARKGVPRTLRRLAALTAPLAVAAFLLGWYDVARYGSLFDTGYADSLMNEVSRAALDRAAYGLFSAHYIARNVWYYFIQGFSFAKGSALVDKEGWSFLLAAPAFLPAFLPLLVPKRHSVEWAAGTLTFTATIAFFLTYYATGGLQFGPRYLNDALPFLYVSLLLLVQARGLARWHRWVIAGSAACNLLLFADFARHLL